MTHKLYYPDPQGESREGLPASVRHVPPWEANAYGLVSLWEILMWHIKIAEMVRTMRQFYELEVRISLAKRENLLNPQNRDAILRHVAQMEENCKATLLNSPLLKIERIKTALTNSPRVSCMQAFFMVKELRERIEDELKSRLFMFVVPQKAPYCLNHNLFGEEVTAAFPLARWDATSAGNCYAFGLNNASVFHSMRVLEHGLEWLASRFSMSFGVDNWGTVIDQIESKIKDMAKTMPKGLTKMKQLEFYAQAAKEFSYFKDAWRNHVMHGRGNYGEDDAKRVLDHVGYLMGQLAPRVLDKK